MSLGLRFPECPVCTSTPAARSSASPPPATWGNGSGMAATTRGDAGRQDGAGAGRRLALVAARLQRHVERRAAGPRACHARASTSAWAWPNGDASLRRRSGAAGDHAADHRIRLDKALPLGRQFQGPLDMPEIEAILIARLREYGDSLHTPNLADEVPSGKPSLWRVAENLKKRCGTPGNTVVCRLISLVKCSSWDYAVARR